MNLPPESGSASAVKSPLAGTRPTVEVIQPAGSQEWIQTLARIPGASVFHHPSWAAVLTRTYGFSPHFLSHSSPDGHRTVLPLMEVRTLSGRRKAVGLPFTDSCPILSTAGELTPDPEELRVVPKPGGLGSPVQELFQRARQLAAEKQWSEIELRLGLVERSGASSSVTFYNHTVALESDDARQTALAESSVRRCLKKFQSGPLTVSVGTSLDFVRRYYGLHCLTRQRQGAPPQPWRFFTHIFEELLDRGMGYIVLVSLESKPIAGAVFLHWGKKAMYKFGASDLSFQHLRPNHGVMWTGLRHGARLGCNSMDLGRTSLDNEGLRRFKSGWGAVETRQVYHCLEVGSNSWRQLSDRTTGWQTHVFRRSPIWLSRIVGQLVYRYAA